MDKENLGAADKLINALLNYNDHLYHGRPGLVVADARTIVGVRWDPATHKEENGQKVVYRLTKVGKKEQKVRVGELRNDNVIIEANRTVGTYRPAGIYPEVAKYMYRQVADIWTLDNEFSARWASFAFGQEHRDLKVVLAAFMLVQSRKGDPVIDGGKVAFHDEDFRDVGEAMMLLTRKDGKDFNPKLLERVYEVLTVPAVVEINRELGFGKSGRKPFYGRWYKAVEKWLNYREENIKMLEGLVKAGFRTSVIDLSRRIGYKPVTPKFFDVLRWKQSQAKDGRRTIAIGKAVRAAESWEGLSETKICQKIVKDKPNYKRIIGLLPSKVGLTRAIVSAAIEAGSMSDKDLIIYTPTLEELGLLQVQDVKERWERAIKAADDMRAANIALRVKSKETQEKLQEAADTAVKRAVEEVVKNIRVYFIVDISGSMEGAIEAAKEYIAKFLQGFPPEQVHVSVFNTAGREIELKHASAAGVTNAFRGIRAGGGTDYGAGVRALQHHKPKTNEDVIFIFVGDEEAQTFEQAVRASGLNPLAFGFVKTRATTGAAGWRALNFADPAAVRLTASALGVPCFLIDEATFGDVYAIPRTIRNLVASTPVSQTAQIARNNVVERLSLAEQILKTDLLRKPVWA